MSLKKQLGELDAKTKALHLRLKKTDNVLKKKDQLAIERHRSSIATLAGEIDHLRGSIQESKFSLGDSEEDVEEWSEGIDAELSLADERCGVLAECLKEMEARARLAEQDKNHEKTMNLEKQLLEQKLEAALKQKEFAEKSTPAVKLPKISITKFNGTPLDWVRFEGQFNAMVDSQKVHGVTKFSHLKELVEPRVRSALDCLPFTEEGYVRALKYLQDKYGHPNEVAGAYVINLLELAPITERDVAKIHKFYEKLLFNVESVATLGKLDTIQGAAFFVIVKKLEILKSELVTHVTGDWRDWTFTQLIEALRKWTDTNTITKVDKRTAIKHSSGLPQARAFQSHDLDIRYDSNKCVYCDSEEHRASNCDKVTSPVERKRILMQRKLCFNCTAGQHSANACKSKMSCRLCHKRHHTSICQISEEPSLTTEVGHTAVVHPVVLVEINGRKFRALLDSGASHSYVSSTLIDLTRAQAVKSRTRRIATLLGVTTTKLLEYDLHMRALRGNFTLNTRVTCINKKELLTLDNPRNEERIATHQHLRGVELEDRPTKDRLPVHIILGVNEYAMIRTRTPLRVGRPGEPVAELTRFGWTIMAPGIEADLSAGFLAVNATADYERLCPARSWLGRLTHRGSARGRQRIPGTAPA